MTPMNFTVNPPEVPTDLNEDTLRRYMTGCRDAMKESVNAIESYKDTINEMANIISLQSEAMQSQNKDTDEVNEYLKKIRRSLPINDEVGTARDVAKKVVQAVAAIFFFLQHLFLLVAQVVMRLAERTIRYVSPDLSCITPSI